MERLQLRHESPDANLEAGVTAALGSRMRGYPPEEPASPETGPPEVQIVLTLTDLSHERMFVYMVTGSLRSVSGASSAEPVSVTR